MLATVLLMVVSSSPLTVKPSCYLDPKGFEVLVEIESRWRKGPDGKAGSSGPELLRLVCDFSTKKCSGLQLNLDSTALSVAALNLIPGNSLSEAKLFSWSGRVAIVTWGVHQWLVSFNIGTVSYSDHAGGAVKDPAEVAVGSASCGSLNEAPSARGVVLFGGL